MNRFAVLSWVLGSSAAITSVLYGCGSSSPVDCGSRHTCADEDASAEGSIVEGGVDAPPGCDANADPKGAPKCVVNDFGVFVDGASGADSNPGTRESPVKSIGAALGKLGGKPRVYVCEGTYPERVKVTGAVSLYGGFACGTWSYSGTKAKVAPTVRGYALEIQKVSAPLVVADLDVTAQDASEPGESSVAAFVNESSAVTLRRVSLTAGAGRDAANAAVAPSNLFSETVADLDGLGAAGATGGLAKVCACKGYGSSTGAKGGNAGNPAPNGEPGTATPAASAMPPRTSAGGDGYTTAIGFCTPGRAGADGAARQGGKGGETLGTLDGNGWTPSAGAAGEAGNPGGGAGGGGGGGVNGSGGGGCGGCGGGGGLAGKGGGASAGIVSFASTIHLDGVVVKVADAGKGGAGGAAGAGGGGGGGGAGGACGGGYGGNGGGGSGGGGGAGGVSGGVMRKGGALDGAPTVTKGQKGAGGGAGALGAGGTNALGTAAGGASGAAGRDGVAEDVVIID